MATESSWEQAVEKLIRLTESGKLVWAPDRFITESREEVQGDAFCASVENHRIAVYEYRFRNYATTDEWEWDTDVAIEFIDGNGVLQCRWPAMPSRGALMDAIRYRAAHGPQFLEAFLGHSS